mmetsp:Transcript_3819/g.7827  ORF Transcript_3819/g.7827 Transcript_3819/m.7827 type:complete len:84 (-) Transcript_3819:2655-2906(-)
MSTTCSNRYLKPQRYRNTSRFPILWFLSSFLFLSVSLFLRFVAYKIFYLVKGYPLTSASFGANEVDFQPLSIRFVKRQYVSLP